MTKKCCICHQPIEGRGNNPEGAIRFKADGTIEHMIFKAKDLCCDQCNRAYVILGRLYMIGRSAHKNQSPVDGKGK